MKPYNCDTTNFNKLHKRYVYAISLAAVLVTGSVAAGEGKQSRKHRGPPPEAIEACAELALDAACSFSGRRGDVEGTCIVPRDQEEQLACKPEGGPRHHRKSEQPDNQE